MNKLDATEWLREEYLTRRKRNPHYSMRSFAQKLGISSGRLSQLLSRKRRITGKMAERIADQLCYLPEQRKEFFKLVAVNLDLDEHVIADEVFSVIADWYHFAILSLMRTKDFSSEPAWIAKRLGICSVTAQSAMERLEHLGLITKGADGYTRSASQIMTTQDIPSAALRLSHSQSIEHANQCLEKVDVALRDITSTTIPVNPEKLNSAKDLIKEFRDRLFTHLSEGDKSEVYNLNVQLVPLTITQRK